MTDITLCRKLAATVGAGESPLLPKIFEALKLKKVRAADFVPV